MFSSHKISNHVLWQLETEETAEKKLKQSEQHKDEAEREEAHHGVEQSVRWY